MRRSKNCHCLLFRASRCSLRCAGDRLALCCLIVRLAVQGWSVESCFHLKAWDCTPELSLCLSDQRIGKQRARRHRSRLRRMSSYSLSGLRPLSSFQCIMRGSVFCTGLQLDWTTLNAYFSEFYHCTGQLLFRLKLCWETELKHPRSLITSCILFCFSSQFSLLNPSAKDGFNCSSHCNLYSLWFVIQEFQRFRLLLCHRQRCSNVSCGGMWLLLICTFLSLQCPKLKY